MNKTGRKETVKFSFENLSFFPDMDACKLMILHEAAVRFLVYSHGAVQSVLKYFMDSTTEMWEDMLAVISRTTTKFKWPFFKNSKYA